MVDFSAGITTRVTTSSEWEAGDLVGISASEIAGTVSTPKYTNIQYKADIAGASTAFSLVETEQEEIAYTSENDMIFTAYYPYTDNKDGVIEANTATTEEEQKKIDFLFASSKGKYIEGNANQKINFTFQHKMARIRLKIKVTDATPIENKSIILGGLIHKGTFNIKSGIASANGNVENDWSLGNLSSTASGTEMEIVRIIYPQNAESLDLRIGNEDDNLKTSFTLPDNKKFEPNNSYTINAEVKDATIHATITIDNNTIKGWNENEPGKTKIAFISNAEDTGSFDAEAGAAYNWLVNTDKYDVEYLSMNDVNENIDLSSYKMIWTHFDFENLNENCQMNQAIKQYYANGGAVFASREAMLSLGIWGIIPAEYSNLTWKFESGDNEQTENPNLTIKDTDHPIFVEFNNPIYSGTYTIKRKFRGWNTQDIGLNTWTSATKANVLAGDINNQNVVSIAEISKETGLQHGCAIVIGDPYFFWQGTDLSTSASLYKLTENILDYLISQSNNK